MLIFCDCSDRDRVRQYFRAGVDGVIPRDSACEIVLAATQLVLVGGQYLPPEVFSPGVSRLGDSSDHNPVDGFRLTPQQGRVLSQVANGLTNREIAHQLSITEGTVKLHVNAILKALGVANRTAAALLARQYGDFPALASPSP